MSEIFEPVKRFNLLTQYYKLRIFLKKSKKVLTNKGGCAIIVKRSEEKDENAAMAQLVEHILGKDEVISSTLISSSNVALAQLDRVFGYEPKGRGFESLMPR